MSKWETFKSYNALADQLLEAATKERLAEALRVLTLNVAHHKAKFGEAPTDDLTRALPVGKVDNPTAALLSSGMEALVGLLRMVWGWISRKAKTDVPTPKQLYKYFAPGRTEFFDSWMLRFTQPAALNDPFEMRVHVEAWGAPDELYKVAENRWEEWASEQYQKREEEFRQKISLDRFKLGYDRKSMIDEAFAKDMEAANIQMAAEIHEFGS